MKKRSWQVFAVLIAASACTSVLAQAGKWGEPAAPGARGDRVPTVKQPTKKPLGGTRATGDEDETNDLEVQRNKRTVDGPSSKSGKPKISDAAPETPRGGDTARRDTRPFGSQTQAPTRIGPMTDPNAPIELKGGTSIPVHK